MKIFAIDDEKAPLYFLCKAIKEACPNDELTEFQNPLEFLEKFEEEKPDVVFLDIEMPLMSGLDLSKKIKEIKENINIIFVTAFTQYALDAFGVNATSYIVKPATKEQIEYALNNLRYEVELEKDIVIRTFGNFDLFYKGNPISFRSEKSKEALAYLVDREGCVVSKKELAGVLYEDDYSNSIQAVLSRNIKYLEEDLIQNGVENFLNVDKGEYWVDLTQASCDYIDYLNGKDVKYLGEYMEQYSFGENRKYLFEKS